MNHALVRYSLVKFTLLLNQIYNLISFGPLHTLEAAVQGSEEREPSTSDGKGDLLGSLSSSFTLQASHSLLSPLHK